jgi:hypothetical protein
MFHNLVHQQINLKIRLKSNSDIDEAVNNFTKIIHSAAIASTNKTIKPTQMHSSSHILPAKIASLTDENAGLKLSINIHTYRPTNHCTIS